MVPFLGLVYLFLVMISTNFAPFSLIFVPFMVLFLASAYLVRRGSRVGFAVSAVLSGFFLILEGTQIYEAMSAVTIPGEFVSATTAVPVLLAVLVYSVLGARMTWKKGAALKTPRMMPASSLVILLLLGFIFGALTVGSIAGQTESRLISSSAGGDITIVQGAGSQNNGQFYTPASFTVKAGTTVTWVNKDGTVHTVTSQGNSLFDSGNVPTGGVFKFTFAQAGTYQYYCTIHPWMKGTIVVTSG